MSAGRPAEAHYFRGGYYSIAELAKHPEALNRNAKRIRERIRSGMSVEAAVTTPKLGKSAAGRKARLNPNVAVFVSPRGEKQGRGV
jgi:hypothetical protein